MSVPALHFTNNGHPYPDSVSLRIGDIGTIYGGLGGKSAPDFGAGSPYITYKQVFDRSEVNLANCGLVSISSGERQNQVALGDVLFTSSSETPKEVGYASVVTVCPGETYLNSFCFGFRARPNTIDPIYSRYLFHAPEYRRQVETLAQGSTRYNISKSGFSKITLTIPSLPEQRRIADALSAVDAKIDLLGRKRDALARFKAGLMQKLFSQEVRFTREDGSEYPDWEEKELSDLAIRSGQRNRDRAITRVLTNSAAHGVVDQLDYFDKDIANEQNNDGYYVVKMGDFVYNPRISSQAPVGPMKRNDVADGIMSPLYTVIRFHSPDTSFYAHYFGTDLWHDYMKSVGNQGARHDRMAVSVRDMMGIPLPVPCVEEASRIAKVGDDLSRGITLIARQIATMQAFKKGLLQQMFV